MGQDRPRHAKDAKGIKIGTNTIKATGPFGAGGGEASGERQVAPRGTLDVAGRWRDWRFNSWPCNNVTNKAPWAPWAPLGPISPMGLEGGTFQGARARARAKLEQERVL